MAYVPIQTKQLEDLTTNGGGAITTTGGSNDTGAAGVNQNAAGITQATTTPGATPNQFVNFQDLVDANSGATTDYAKSIGNLIGLGDTSNALGANQTAADNQVTQGYNDVGDDVVNKVLADPNNTGFDGYNTLKSILGGGGYTGPTSANDLYSGAEQALSGLNDKASTLNDTAGLQSLLLAHPNTGTTTGGASLDAALLAGTQGSQDQIANVQKQVSDLQNSYNTDVAQTQQNIGDKQAQATARKAQIVGEGQGALNSITSQGQQALAAKTAQEQGQVDAFQQAAKTGDFSTLRGLIPGLDDTQLSSIVSQLTTKPTDFSQYATVTNPNLTLGNVISAADQARYNGINNTFGLNAAGIDAAGQEAGGSFNLNDAMANLNAKLSSQRDAAAALKAQQDAAAAAAQAGTGSMSTIGTPIHQGSVGSDGYVANSNIGGAGGGDGGDSGSSAGVSGQDANAVSSTPASTIGTVAAVAAAVAAPSPASIANAISAVANTVSEANALSDAAAVAAANPSDADVSGLAAADSAAAAADAADAASADGTAADGPAGDSSADGGSAASGDSGATGGDSGGDSGGDGGGGGGGGGGKIICTAMNDLYGLPYAENKVWIKYAKTNLRPEHQIGYHKVFLPLVDYGFKQGDGLGNRFVRHCLVYIGKHRTIDIQAELNGTYRRPVHKFLRAVIEPTLAAIGKWSKK